MSNKPFVRKSISTLAVLTITGVSLFGFSSLAHSSGTDADPCVVAVHNDNSDYTAERGVCSAVFVEEAKENTAAANGNEYTGPGVGEVSPDAPSSSDTNEEVQTVTVEYSVGTTIGIKGAEWDGGSNYGEEYRVVVVNEVTGAVVIDATNTIQATYSEEPIDLAHWGEWTQHEYEESAVPPAAPRYSMTVTIGSDTYAQTITDFTESSPGVFTLNGHTRLETSQPGQPGVWVNSW